jgi:hypothetical protein
MNEATKYYIASYSVWAVTAVVAVLLIKKGLEAAR